MTLTTDPAPAQPVLPYASHRDPNRDATRSLVWGILGVVPLFLPGILAIRCGRSAARTARAAGTGANKARVGTITPNHCPIAPSYSLAAEPRGGGP